MGVRTDTAMGVLTDTALSIRTERGETAGERSRKGRHKGMLRSHKGWHRDAEIP